MKQYKRSERFNKLLIEEVSEIVQRELKDPRIGFVSFTRVETRRPAQRQTLRQPPRRGAGADTLEALRHAAGMIRGELMHRIQARRIPSCGSSTTARSPQRPHRRGARATQARARGRARSGQDEGGGAP